MPHDFISRDGLARSNSKNSKDALVLKEASSCWADVPEKRQRKKTPTNVGVKLTSKIQ